MKYYQSLISYSLRPLLFALASISLISLSASPMRAALVLDFTGGNANTFGGNATVGWEFTVASPMSVTALGYWDHGSNGLVNTHDVGIWNMTNQSLLLTSTTVTNGNSAPVASTSPTGRWLFTNIPALTLAPGTYVIGATIVALDADSQRFSAVATTMPGVTFVQARNVSSTNLFFPTPSPVFNDGVFGPNLIAIGVPEPASLFLIACAGVFVATRRRR